MQGPAPGRPALTRAGGSWFVAAAQPRAGALAEMLVAAQRRDFGCMDGLVQCGAEGVSMSDMYHTSPLMSSPSPSACPALGHAGAGQHPLGLVHVNQPAGHLQCVGAHRGCSWQSRTRG